jgi:DNA-directed RNA polymerase specialized sigma24 family protein
MAPRCGNPFSDSPDGPTISSEHCAELFVRLRLYLRHRFYWAAKHGLDLDDVAQQAIVDTATGKRRWPPVDIIAGRARTDVDLFTFLCNVARGIISHLFEARKRIVSMSSLELEGNGHSQSLIDSFQSNRYDPETTASYNILADRMIELLAEDQQLVQIVKLLRQDPGRKWRDIADILGISPRNVYAARKRLQRKLLKRGFVREQQYRRELEPSRESELLEQPGVIAFAVFDDQIKLVALASDGKYRYLDGTKQLHNILYLATSETLALQSVVDELESLVNDPNAKESHFQDFFERNPDFILSGEYKTAHPHIILTRDDGDALIPDFVLEPIDQNSVCDILELKLPSAPVFVLKKNRPRFSMALSEACAQLREYSAFFDEERNRRLIQSKYGLLAYQPKMFLVIGRQGSVDPIVRRRVEASLPRVYLRTYDDVIQQARHKICAMKRSSIPMRGFS